MQDKQKKGGAAAPSDKALKDFLAKKPQGAETAAKAKKAQEAIDKALAASAAAEKAAKKKKKSGGCGCWEEDDEEGEEDAWD